MSDFYPCRKYKPTEPGEYNVMIPGISSIVPMFLMFDGQNWIGLERLETGWQNPSRREVLFHPEKYGPFVRR